MGIRVYLHVRQEYQPVHWLSFTSHWCFSPLVLEHIAFSSWWSQAHPSWIWSRTRRCQERKSSTVWKIFPRRDTPHALPMSNIQSTGEQVAHWEELTENLSGKEKKILPEARPSYHPAENTVSSLRHSSLYPEGSQFTDDTLLGNLLYKDESLLYG